MKVWLIGCLLAVGCGEATPGRQDAPVRDVRPTKLQRGEKLLVEGSGPIFQVGAPTTITFDNIWDVNKQPLATSSTRVLRSTISTSGRSAPGQLSASRRRAASSTPRLEAW